MKQKEEKLLQAQRTRTLINVEGQHLLRLVHHALGLFIVKVLVTVVRRCSIYICFVQWWASAMNLSLYFRA
jgi:hypothetical protein